ncbi:uncharacterized protein LOC124658458 [Lolium rigidum]|uniref:uncharacterized protein LOC124658458 n=1 Tax=Lolium rigidum TaxID=89674 RepID=UPI001F5E2288|nr:uncharacterized protein LOC124658458 [Lolium rigidum]
MHRYSARPTTTSCSPRFQAQADNPSVNAPGMTSVRPLHLCMHSILDTCMMYLEPAKFVAKLSELKTDGSSCYSSAILVLGTFPTQEVLRNCKKTPSLMPSSSSTYGCLLFDSMEHS